MNSLQPDFRDVAVLLLSGFGYVVALITNFMNPMIMAAALGLIGVIIRVGFDFYKYRRDSALIKERDYWKTKFEQLKVKE